MLLSVGPLSENEIGERYGNVEGRMVEVWLEELTETGRVTTFSRGDGGRAWVAVESVREIMGAYPDAVLRPHAARTISQATVTPMPAKPP